jgi:DNA-binding response OmpR family regulator
VSDSSLSESPGRGAPRSTASILLVEDDPAVVRTLRDNLEPRGYRIWHAQNAAEALLLAEEVDLDVILLNIMLPDGDGLALCPQLRQRTEAPIIACSGSKRRNYAVLALKLGASDFIAKPFYLPELEARIEAVRRRAAARQPGPGSWAGAAVPLRLGALTIDRAGHRVVLAGETIHLTPTEYRLLEVLASRPGHVVSRAELVRTIWGHDDPVLADTLGVHARRLRAKLRQDEAAAPSIVAVRGVGYRIL